MSQIKKKFIGNDEVGAEKVRLENDLTLRARNAADDADIDILKISASDVLEMLQMPHLPSQATQATHAVRKDQLDAALQGLKPKEAARAATNNDIALDGSVTMVDGVSLSDGDRVLVKGQTLDAQNGIYVATNGVAWVRAVDFDQTAPVDEINGAMVPIQEGTTNGGKVFVQQGLVATIGVDAINFVYFNSVSTLVGGDGITISGNNISVDINDKGLGFNAGQLTAKVDDTTIVKNLGGGTDELGVKDGGIGVAKLKLGTVAANVDEINADTFAMNDEYDSSLATGNVAIGDSTQTAVEKLEKQIIDLTAAQPKEAKETIALDAAMVLAQKVTLTNTPIADSVSFEILGAGSQLETIDYTVSGLDVAFTGDLATGGDAELDDTDIVVVTYRFI